MIISRCIDLVKDLIGRDEGIGNNQADIVLTPVLLIGIRNSGHGHPSSVFFIVDATSQEIIGGQKITAGWERDGTRIIYRIQARMEARAQWHWKTSRALAILLHTPVFLLWPRPCMVMPTGRRGGWLHTLCPRFGQCPCSLPPQSLPASPCTALWAIPGAVPPNSTLWQMSYIDHPT